LEQADTDEQAASEYGSGAGDECETPLEMATAAGLMAIAEILARKGEPLRQRLRSGLNLPADMPGIGDLVRRQHKYRRVTIPACAALIESVQRNGTLRGMVGVYREGRYYSILTAWTSC
jgi:hypothetical protein